LSKLIIEARETGVIKTTTDLKKAIKPCTPKFEENRYLAKVFQAIRMEVNHEMEVLEECLTQCVEVLKPAGRLVIMSYHSLEDRLVKNIMKTGNVKGIEHKDIIYGTSKKIFRLITSKPIVPTDEEIKQNSRARSAKLRVGEKI
jgi:16S rRNA (cytosine1402-N4)-methyltransferase